jgi:hypothetical protein
MMSFLTYITESSWIKDGADGHNFERGPPKDHFSSLVEIDSVVSEEKIFFYFIQISSNGQNCSILSQKVPKFELYKHNDELFNIYYGLFYEL